MHIFQHKLIQLIYTQEYSVTQRQGTLDSQHLVYNKKVTYS